MRGDTSLHCTRAIGKLRGTINALIVEIWRAFNMRRGSRARFADFVVAHYLSFEPTSYVAPGTTRRFAGTEPIVIFFRAYFSL